VSGNLKESGDEETTRLGRQDFDRVTRKLDAEREPNDLLRAAAARYRALAPLVKDIPDTK
jgi:hypothetical protein